MRQRSAVSSPRCRFVRGIFAETEGTEIYHGEHGAHEKARGFATPSLFSDLLFLLVLHVLGDLGDGFAVVVSARVDGV